MAVQANPSKGQKVERWVGTGEVSHEENHHGGRAAGCRWSFSRSAGPGERGVLHGRGVGAWSLRRVQPDLWRLWCPPGRQRDRCRAATCSGLRATSTASASSSLCPAAGRLLCPTAACGRLPERLCLRVLLPASLEIPSRSRRRLITTDRARVSYQGASGYFPVPFHYDLLNPSTTPAIARMRSRCL